jgi:N-acetylglucosamine-6-phosphate deacetylase
LPTLITDSPAITEAAIAAAIEAASRPGSAVAGLHLEGPHLALARKGAHRADLIRPMTDADLRMLLAAAARLPVLLLTLAQEAASLAQVQALVRAGVVVSLGHSDCDAATAFAYAEAGARGVTHLFNAMSGLGHRAPGLVGAALDDGRLWGGIIADGHHADPMSLRIALRAKRGPGRLFLVTDAMALVGHAGDSFQLNGREIRRHPGGGGLCSRLTLADGTLAGSDLDMASAVRLAHRMLDLDLTDALAMATRIPADFLRLPDRGRLAAGCRADMVALDADLQVARVWRNGA